MTVRPLQAQGYASTPATPAAAPEAPSVRDSVQLDGAPRLMAGAPTGWLSPQIPPPTHFAVPVGIEIFPGVGISLDGHALLIGHSDRTERIDIVGHLEDGTFPQRDFTVTRDGRTTAVDGYYDHQDYTLVKDGDAVAVDGLEDRDDLTVRQDGSGFRVESAFAAKQFTVTTEGNVAHVDSGWDPDDFEVIQDGNTTRVVNEFEEKNLSLTRNDDGTITVQGHYRFQDFTITPSEDGFVIQGLYPQQRYAFRYS